MSSRSRSRSRSGSRSSVKRSYRRNIRDESISPIRTASGANLRTPKQYNSQNQGYGYRNYQNYNNYGNRNYNNYNNRGYYNQRYNNYGNRWNRGGRGYQNRGYQNRNQWNYQGRSRYNSRSDRSRSRSRSRSYDRSRSLSDSGSRSRSRSRDRNRRRRSRSYHSSGRSRSPSPKSRSRSKTPTKVAELKKEMSEEKETMIPKPQEADVKPPGEEDTEIPVEKKPEVKQPTFAESSAFTRSRWETPEPSPVRQKGEDERYNTADIDLQQDKIFDQWDDDKLRAYLLKSKGKKLGKDSKKLSEGVQADPPVMQEVAKTKKKKRSKSNTQSPAKETRGRKKKRSVKQSVASPSSSSSSSWSPIHKAPEPKTEEKSENENDNQPMGEVAHVADANQYNVETAQIYSQQQNYSISAERTQAVQYPFSQNIRKPALIPQPPQVSIQSVPAPVPPPPQTQQPTTAPALGEMQILGPDGTPVTLVPTMVLGPDGKMMQVMQIKPAASVVTPPVSVPTPDPVSPPKQSYRAPPPPPSYPPPMTQSDTGKYFSQTTMPVTSATTVTSYQSDSQLYPMLGNDRHSFEKPNGNVEKLAEDVQVVQNVEDKPYEVGDHTSGLKKMEMAEKQKRRQEVLRTRFKPRPASTWAQEVKQDGKEEKPIEPKPTPRQTIEEPQAIPTLGNTTGARMTKPTKQEYKMQEQHKIKTITSDNSGWQSQAQPIPVTSTPVPAPQMPVKIEPPTVQSQQMPAAEKKIENKQPYSQMPPQLAAQGFKPVYGNPQLVMGPNGEMLQLISAPQSEAVAPQATSALSVPSTSYPEVGQHRNIQADYWSNTAGKFAPGNIEKPEKTTKKAESSSSNDEDMPVVAPPQRKRTVSAGSEKKAKKKTKSRSISIEEGDNNDDVEPTVKRKKESKKKKKKNKKKKEEADDDEAPVKEKKKKKEKKQKEKPEFDGLEHETLKSKKDLKGLQEVKKKSKKDDLNRSIGDDLSLSHIRGIVPRRKGEQFHVLLKHVNFESRTKSSLATSTSYEERFVSLFGSGDPEPAPAEEEETRVDITKKSVRKFKVHMKGARDVTHMTEISLSDRVKKRAEGSEEKTPSQKVSLNVSSLSKTSFDGKSASKSPSRSTSASSDSREASRKRRKSPTRSRSTSASNSRSRSRSVSLPLAYSGADGKPNKREVIPPKRYRSGSRDYSDDDDEKRRGSRSRSRSYSPEDRRQRQPYYNRNNQNYFYNNRGRGYYNNRGYQNYNRGWGRYNNYQNRGNFRGRFQNWNNQGYRNQNYRYQRYDNRDDRSRRDRSYSRSPDRSKNRDDRSSSRERDDKKDNKYDDKSPSREKKTIADQPSRTEEKASEIPPMPADGVKLPKKQSPAQWGHDMFEEEEKQE